MAAYDTPLNGKNTGRGWTIGPPLTQITASEHVISCYDYTQDWPDPACEEPEPPAPTCPPWKFSEQRNKRHSHRRTNKKGKR